MNLLSSWKEVVDAAYIYEAPEDKTKTQITSSTNLAEVLEWLEVLEKKQLETQATLSGIQDKWDLWTKVTAGELKPKPQINGPYGINKLRSQLQMRVKLQIKLHGTLKDKIAQHAVVPSTASLTPNAGVKAATDSQMFGVKAAVEVATTLTSTPIQAQVRTLCNVDSLFISLMHRTYPPHPRRTLQVP